MHGEEDGAVPTGNRSRLDRIRPFLVCPACRGGLRCNAAGAYCERCDKLYPERDHRLHFLEIPTAATDPQDRLKEKLKRLLGRHYYTVGVDLISPNFPFNFRRMVLQHVDPAVDIVLDVGCGNHRLHEEIICVDLFDYPAVDVVCDAVRLPFKDDAVAACISRSMLEHVPEADAVVAEYFRVTRPEGFSIHLIPFMMPFHASPYDFRRYTDRGAALLFGKWQLVGQQNPTGPVSSLLNVLIEFLSILCSFGNGRAKAFFYLGFCGLLFPLKFLDWPFVNRPSFLTLAANILTIVRKPRI